MSISREWVPSLQVPPPRLPSHPRPAPHTLLLHLNFLLTFKRTIPLHSSAPLPFTASQTLIPPAKPKYMAPSLHCVLLRPLRPTPSHDDGIIWVHCSHGSQPRVGPGSVAFTAETPGTCDWVGGVGGAWAGKGVQGVEWVGNCGTVSSPGPSLSADGGRCRDEKSLFPRRWAVLAECVGLQASCPSYRGRN